jgi:hypothetical protein
MHFGLETAFLEQSAAKLVQPLSALAQPFEQGDIREVGQIGCPSPHRRLTHRKPAPQVHQQNPQIIFRGFVLAQTFCGIRR